MKNPFLFDLAKSKPLVDKKKSGSVRGAYEKNFPVVQNQAGAMFLVILDKGGIREPHWHPNAWEFDYCISGRARMSVVAPDNKWNIFDVEPGQAVFVPQGYFHYFENIGDDELHFLVVFNNSAAEVDDDIGISVSLGGVPRHRDVRGEGGSVRPDPEAAQGGGADVAAMTRSPDGAKRNPELGYR